MKKLILLTILFSFLACNESASKKINTDVAQNQISKDRKYAEITFDRIFHDFGNLNEAQFTLFWKCWENNLRVINDIIPIILRNKTYGPPMKIFMYGILKAGTWAIMRYLRGLCKDLFNGRLPEDIVERYARSRSVAAPNYTK